MKKISIFILLCMSLFVRGNDTLVVKIDEMKETSISFDQWEKKYSKYITELKVTSHPNYKNVINYRGITFSSFLKDNYREIKKDDLIIVTCTDGYRPVLDGNLFQDGKAVLAFSEVEPKENITEDKRWTKVKMENELVTPGPYYLVWPSMEGHKHSWPYQIQKIEILKKDKFEEFSKIRPKNKNAYLGFEVFKNKCIKCHSIKYIGPKGKAPDLAYVMGYRSNDFIKNRIRKGQGKMPPFSKLQLKESDIDEVLKYLKAIYDEN